MRKTTLLTSLLISVLFVTAQEPVSWNFYATKTKGSRYEIHLTATIASPWHIYSQFTPSGGPVPTEIKFKNNPLVALEDKVIEKGEQVKKHEAVFKTDVLFYNGAVDFVQLVKIKGKIKTNIGGTIRYMVCNDKECLAPKIVNFQIDLK